MNKHTPGPWVWGEDYCGLYGSGRDREVMTHQRFEGMWLSHVDSQEANARLIAAAPDLLEALEDSLTALNIVYPNGSPVLNAATHAIAKARGGA